MSSEDDASFGITNNLGRIVAKKVLTKLQKYLAIKGVLLRRKIAPAGHVFVEGNPESNVMEEFLMHTDLVNYDFWNKLDRSQRLAAYRYMTLREMAPHRVVSVFKRAKADIFIVLAGTGHMKDSRSESKIPLKIGSVFGALSEFEHFERTYVPAKMTEEHHEVKSCVGVLQTGSLIRLRLVDFQMALFGQEVDAETEFLASLPPAERLIYDARKIAMSALSPGLLDVLEANDLIPTHPDDPAFSSLCKGVFQRKIEIHQGEPATVIVVLSGTIDINLKRRKATLLALREDNESATISVKVTSTPLMRIESGSLICLDEKCFTRPTPPSLTLNEALDDMTRARKIMKAKANDSQAAVTITDSSPNGTATNTAQSSNDFPYHLELVFASSCVYLRLPLSDLKMAMKEQDYKTTFEIMRQLNVINSTIVERINQLDLWDAHDVSFHVKQQSAGETWGIIEKEVPKPKSMETEKDAGDGMVGHLQGTYTLWTRAVDSDDMSDATNEPLFAKRMSSSFMTERFPLDPLDNDDISINSASLPATRAASRYDDLRTTSRPFGPAI